MDIKQLLPPENVAVGITAKNWQEAVRAVGKLLVDSGSVEERYIEGMIRTTNELGPYIVIAPGLAIPHARPEDGAIRPCMAVGSLETPVSFGNQDNDPVRILIALGATDHEQHVQAMGQMAEILSVPENLKALMVAESVEEIIDIMWRTN